MTTKRTGNDNGKNKTKQKGEAKYRDPSTSRGEIQESFDCVAHEMPEPLRSG
jgi:hypothetical protein